MSLSLDLSEFVPGGILYGAYMTDGDYDTRYVSNLSAGVNPEDIWMLGFQANLTDEVEFVALYNHSSGGAFFTPACMLIRLHFLHTDLSVKKAMLTCWPLVLTGTQQLLLASTSRLLTTQEAQTTQLQRYIRLRRSCATLQVLV